MTDKQEKARTKLAREVQSSCDQLIQSFEKLQALDLEIYKSLKNPDVLFYDSPLSPSRTVTHLRQYLAKLGAQWAMFLIDGPVAVRPFIDEMKLNQDWAKRFSQLEDIDRLV